MDNSRLARLHILLQCYKLFLLQQFVGGLGTSTVLRKWERLLVAFLLLSPVHPWEELSNSIDAEYIIHVANTPIKSSFKQRSPSQPPALPLGLALLLYFKVHHTPPFITPITLLYFRDAKAG